MTFTVLIVVSLSLNVLCLLSIYNLYNRDSKMKLRLLSIHETMKKQLSTISGVRELVVSLKENYVKLCDSLRELKDL